MNKTILISGVIFGTLAIVLGAFATHGLKEILHEEALDSFKTGVTYQMYHALFLLILGSVQKLTATRKKEIFYLITTGTIFFSFSIYLLSTSAHTGIDFGFLGIMTPFGGVLLIAGWILFGYRVFKQFN